MNGIEKHVGQSPWTVFTSIIWLLPIVLIVISFFSNFFAFAIIALIGFLGVLVGNYYYMLLKNAQHAQSRRIATLLLAESGKKKSYDHGFLDVFYLYASKVSAMGHADDT
jgi:hypothetical protein